jgi:multiple sugar transport system ATP-binding protein
MNLVEATIEDEKLRFGSFALPIDVQRRPPARGRFVAGIRPEAFEDAAFAAPDLPRIDVKVEVLESIGSDAFVFFRVDAKPVVVEDALSDDAEDATTLLADEGAAAMFHARVDARTKARVGEQISLAVDPSRVYYFAPETGESVLDRRAA